MTLRVGLLIGQEWSFPSAFIEQVRRHQEGVVAELVKLGGTWIDEPCPYTVIIDRISHEIPYYRIYLKYAVLQGVMVINNPFMWTADDKFFEVSLAKKMGIASPKTVVLPNKDYNPNIDHTQSLRNLSYPLDWQAIIKGVGTPCVLKDVLGDGCREVCQDLGELLGHYNQLGPRTAMVQENIEGQHYVRCICLGQEEVLLIKYDPAKHKCIFDNRYFSSEPELSDRIKEDSLKLVRALGYDMSSLEWAIRDGVPYITDFVNPAPDLDIYSLTPVYFDWVIKHMAEMIIQLAKQPRPQQHDLRWDAFLRENRDRVENRSASDASA